jgi:hypothetical protein
MRKYSIMICMLLVLPLSGCIDTRETEPPITPENTIEAPLAQGNTEKSTTPPPSTPAATQDALSTPASTQNAKSTPAAAQSFDQYLADRTAAEIEAGIVCSGDLDADGGVEYLYKYTGASNYRGVDYYLLHRAGDTYTDLGLLPDDFSVGHIITDTHILHLDTGAQQYVVLDVAHEIANAYGYFIYGYDGVNISGPLINFPDATAYGTRELADSDGDGVYEHTDYYRKDDLQQHLLIVRTPFCRDQLSDGSFAESEYSEYMLSYQNTEGRFIYPGTPEEVIQCYIEAKWLFSPKPQEILDELSAMTCTPEPDIDLSALHPLNAKYNGIDIQLEVLSKTDDTRTIKASDWRENHIIFTVIKQDGKWRIKKITAG